MKKYAIIGSRTFTNYVYLVNELSKFDIQYIVSGGAKGTDSLARKYAILNNIPYIEYLPDYAKYGRSAPLKRNHTIIENSDIVIAFWDGKSTGTKYTLDIAKRLNKEIHIIAV